MKLPLVLAGGALLAAALSGSVQAGWHGGGPIYRPAHGMPPIAGTIRVHPDNFGHAGDGRPGPSGYRPAPQPQFGGGSPGFSGRSRFGGGAPFRTQGPAYGYQGRAYAQLAAQNGGGGYGHGGYGGRSGFRREGFSGIGTGVVGTGVGGLIGATGATYDGLTGWGTADSATTGGYYAGGGYPGYSGVGYSGYSGGGYSGYSGGGYSGAGYQADTPVSTLYGEPDVWNGTGGAAPYAPTGGLGYYGSGSPGRLAYYSAGSSAGPYGSPTGGLGYYGSGSPGRLAYYSSGSSAGPYGSPGGLGVYSAGAYGPGPKIIHIGRRYAGSDRRECSCTARVVYQVRHRTYARW